MSGSRIPSFHEAPLVLRVDRAAAQAVAVDWCTFPPRPAETDAPENVLPGPVGIPIAQAPGTEPCSATAMDRGGPSPGRRWIGVVRSPGTPPVRVRLEPDQRIRVSWPRLVSGWVLESAYALASPACDTCWSPVQEGVRCSATETYVIEPAPPDRRFYRLRPFDPGSKD